MCHHFGKNRWLNAHSRICRNASVSPSDSKAFYYELEWVENRVIFLIAEGSVDNSRGYEHCVWLVVSLYHRTVPRPLRIWSGVYATIAGKLKSALLWRDLGTLWQLRKELLLWILTPVALANIEGQTKSWFLNLVKHLLSSSFPNWNVIEIKDSLRNFL